MQYRSLRKWKYELLEGMECEVDIHPDVVAGNQYITLEYGILFVLPRYAWDGPSGPTIDTPTNMRASLFHDALCQGMAEDLLDRMYREYADELLRIHMLEDQIKDANGLLVIYGTGGMVLYQAKKKKGLKRAIYLRWGRFRANGYYNVVRAYSKFRGM